MEYIATGNANDTNFPKWRSMRRGDTNTIIRRGLLSFDIKECCHFIERICKMALETVRIAVGCGMEAANMDTNAMVSSKAVAYT